MGTNIDAKIIGGCIVIFITGWYVTLSAKYLELKKANN